jgi:hypothetical protein
MSALLFGRSTSARLDRPPQAPPDKDGRRDLSTSVVNAVAGLVPAEALLLQQVILQFTSTTTKARKGHPSTTVVTHGHVLGQTFWALIVVSAVAYLLGRWTSNQALRLLDLAGVAIAALAYVVWSALQSPSAFAAFFTHVSSVDRQVWGSIAAVVLVLLAPAFGYTVAQATPKKKRNDVTTRQAGTHAADAVPTTTE